MFLQELSPLVQELIQQPMAFATGFFSGALKLNLQEDPLKDWLDKQGIDTTGSDSSNNPNQPQSISID